MNDFSFVGICELSFVCSTGFPIGKTKRFFHFLGGKKKLNFLEKAGAKFSNKKTINNLKHPEQIRIIILLHRF